MVTVHIDPHLHAQLRRQARETGRSVDALVDDALRAMLKLEPGSREAMDALPVRGGTGVRPGVDLSSNARMFDVMDGLDG